MPDYQQGKIYMITTQKNCKIYIGSTSKTLHERFLSHKSKYRRWLDGSNKEYITAYEILEYDDCKIELIEECPCNDKTEIYKREAHHMMLNRDFIVNKHITGRTRAEFREDNKERLKEENKEWRDNNPEYIKEHNRTYYDENKEAIMEQHREYIQANREVVTARLKKYMEANYDRVRSKDNEAKRKKYMCVECNKEISVGNKSKHEVTAKHIKNYYKLHPVDV
jgi:hypothetical protein